MQKEDEETSKTNLAKTATSKATVETRSSTVFVIKATTSQKTCSCDEDDKEATTTEDIDSYKAPKEEKEEEEKTSKPIAPTVTISVADTTTTVETRSSTEFAKTETATTPKDKCSCNEDNAEEATADEKCCCARASDTAIENIVKITTPASVPSENSYADDELWLKESIPELREEGPPEMRHSVYGHRFSSRGAASKHHNTTRNSIRYARESINFSLRITDETANLRRASTGFALRKNILSEKTTQQLINFKISRNEMSNTNASTTQMIQHKSGLDYKSSDDEDNQASTEISMSSESETELSVSETSESSGEVHLRTVIFLAGRNMARAVRIAPTATIEIGTDTADEEDVLRTTSLKPSTLQKMSTPTVQQAPQTSVKPPEKQCTRFFTSFLETCKKIYTLPEF